MREPFYRKSRKAWFVWIDGKQTKLATTKKEAYQEWAKLQTEPVNSTAPCVVLFDKFLDWTKANRSERTYEWYQFHLQSFSVSIGKRLTISQLRPHHVSDWIQNVHHGSTNNTIHGAMRSVQRACNWAVKEGYIARSPMGTLEKPSPTSRDTVIPPDLWQKMIELASDQEEHTSSQVHGL
ncbi:MAG: phage integrase SAM-like domain-containing protein [Planctomycetota bacterium]